jgi:hypothetical protein
MTSVQDMPQVHSCSATSCYDKLECTAPSVDVGARADVADCLTYEAR